MVDSCPKCGKETYVKDDTQIISGRRKPKIVMGCIKCNWTRRDSC